MRELMKIEWIDSTESTNKVASCRFDSLDNMTVIFTSYQSAGVGQGDHTWHSVPGENLLFTLVLKAPELQLESSSAQALTWFTALSVLDYLKIHNIAASIKLPNDIWVDGKKICGILINNRITAGQISGSIIGVGLNLNETEWPEDLPNPVSVRELTGSKYEIHREMEALFKCFEGRFGLLNSAEGLTFLEKDFSSKLIERL